MIDGFPAEPGRSDELIQREIEEELRNCEALRGTYALNQQRFPKWFQLTPAGRAAWAMPLLDRAEWHVCNGDEGGRWLEDVSLLLELTLRETTSLPDAALAQLARLVPAFGRAGRNQPLDTLANLLQKRKSPIEGELLLAAHLALRSHRHSKLAWALFLAPESPDEAGGSCWSAAARSSLRSMPAAEKKAWNGLWSGAATRKAVEKIGLPIFEARFREWLTPLKASRPHELSSAGETLLKHLLRAVAAVPELQVDEPLYWLAGAR
jgi:hypothetical protein